MFSIQNRGKVFQKITGQIKRKDLRVGFTRRYIRLNGCSA
jgi:hypothetical protein